VVQPFLSAVTAAWRLASGVVLWAGAARRTGVTDLSETPSTLAEALVEAEKRNASLSARLASYRQSTVRLRPDVARVYDELVARLNMIDAGEVGPKLGEALPAFDLPDENGQLVSLSSLLRKGPAVVSINRGHWCPYCKLDLRSLAAVHDEIRALGARVVSIMPDTATFTSSYSSANALPFPVLSDMDLGYSLLLGLIFWVGPEVQRLYEDVGIDLERYQGNGGHFLPMAAKFVVGQDGLVKARQVNTEFRERMEPETVLAALHALRAGAGDQRRAAGDGRGALSK
jgi:peroxiredoxin